MKSNLLLVLLIGLFQIPIIAQSSPTCTSISVTGPGGPIAPGENIIFTANVSKEYDASKLKYLWTVLKGKFVSGQGTSSLIVAFENNVLTATVEVQGLPVNCANTASDKLC